MRLLLLITDLEIGGTPTVVRELAIRLRRSGGAEVHVGCLKGFGLVARQLQQAGVPVKSFTAGSVIDLPAVISELRSYIREHQIDTVLSFLIHSNTAAAIASRDDASRAPHGPAATAPGVVAKLPANAQLAMSKVPRATPDTTDMHALVAANSQFAFDLYHQLAKANTNLFFSPESISNALAMAYAGARGTTASEMASTLHFKGLPGDELHAAFNALAQELLAPRTSKDKGRKPLELDLSGVLRSIVTTRTLEPILREEDFEPYAKICADADKEAIVGKAEATRSTMKVVRSIRTADGVDRRHCG